MLNDSEGFSVTLSAELFEHIRTEARRLDLPMEWLIASLIVDTIEEREPVEPVV
jgi:hypothetical protein